MDNSQKEAIRKLTVTLKRQFRDEFSGHDWFYIERVRKMAKKQARKRHIFMNAFLREFFQELEEAG